MGQAMDANSLNGSCHCGTVRFHAKLVDGLRTARRCTCSYCRMRGAIAVSASSDGITMLSGEEALTVYQFNTMTAKHFFCCSCGIYTFHQRRSNPHQYGVNVACLENISPFDFEEIPVIDGINHPNDTKDAGVRIIGHLKFVRISNPI